MSSSVSSRLTRIFAVALVLGASLVLTAGPTRAGGPTSALLVSPSTGQTAAVYYSDPEYDALSTALGGYSPAADPDFAETPPGNSTYITVTWMIHDVSVWRIDRIFLGEPADPAGPVIVTQVSDGSEGTGAGMYPGEAGTDSGIWHRSGDPTALLKLLSTLGLIGPAQQQLVNEAAPAPAVAAAPAATTGVDAAAVDAAAVDAAAGDAAAGDPAARPGVTWWWAFAGLLAGVVLTALAVRFVPPVRRRIVDRADAEEPVRMVHVPV